MNSKGVSPKVWPFSVTASVPVSVGMSGRVISNPVFVLLLHVNVVLTGQVLIRCVGVVQ